MILLLIYKYCYICKNYYYMIPSSNLIKTHPVLSAHIPKLILYDIPVFVLAYISLTQII